jgi:Arc/MetJ-type ribon-helix-helix transcriptional regulator
VRERAISVRLDDEAARALEILMGEGKSRSEAIREAVVDSARRRVYEIAAADAARVVADEDDRRKVEGLDQLAHVFGERVLVGRVDRIAGERARVAEAEEVGGDDASEGGGGCEDMAVVEPEARPAVEENEPRSLAGGDVVHPASTQVGDCMLNLRRHQGRNAT